MTRRRTFSQRRGITPVSEKIQTDGIDDALRTALWNAVNKEMRSIPGFFPEGYREVGLISSFSEAIWDRHFKRPVDTRPADSKEIYNELRRHFLGAEWFEVYNFLEAVLQWWPDYQNVGYRESLQARLNDALERERSGFRFIDFLAVQITDAEEIKSIEEAIRDDRFAAVSEHLSTALHHLSRRPTPDFRNSIKESISAVEAMAREVTGKKKATLPDALDALARSKKPLHPALRGALEKLYGYTSDDAGIRHALEAEPDLSLADARFMLVACSAFVNLLKETAFPPTP